MTGTEIVGPFHEYRVAWGGYQVPHIQAVPQADGRYMVVVDNRFGLHEAVTKEQLDNWMPILAHAMAVAAGWSCHGENSQRVNEYKVGMNRIDVPPKLTVVDGGKTDDDPTV